MPGLISTFHLSTSNHESESPTSNVKELHHHPSVKWQWIVFSELRDKFSPRSWQRCAHVSFRLFLSSLWQVMTRADLYDYNWTENEGSATVLYQSTPLWFYNFFQFVMVCYSHVCLCKLDLKTIFSQRKLSANPEPALLRSDKRDLCGERVSLFRVLARALHGLSVLWFLETYELSWNNIVPSQEKNAWNLQNYVACFRLQC